MRLMILALFVGLTACGHRHDSSPTTVDPECSGPDLNQQQVTWPDGVSRKSNVYHCNNGEDLIYDNADASKSFWQAR